ncbi:MAG: hypothetical protein BWY31_02327 [Lentisphaerae bacterium ADurb.Bin242]|nr:MAG: hypothetical protein BWY31_02327 [Lentisphaerae bacterium ADurb.Bin242]
MKYFLCGGTEAFRMFFRTMTGADADLTFFSAPDQIPLDDAGNSPVYVLLPDYEKGVRRIPEMDFERVMRFLEWKRNGARLYVENYDAQDYLHSGLSGCQIVGRERFFFQEYLRYDGGILQARGSYYHPVLARSETLASVENCIGTHTVFREGAYSFPVLSRCGEHGFSAAMNLSAYDVLFMRPRHRWRKLYADLWSEVAGRPRKAVERAFDRVFPERLNPSGGTSPDEAVRKALEWHEKSGLLRAPDGSQGMFEMIRSNDLGVRSNLRTDSELLTGAFFAMAGKHCRSERLVETGCNLADFLLDRNIQEPGGFFKWFDNKDTVYSSDCARGGLAMVNLYRCTGRTRYLEAARSLADAFLRWLAKDGLCCGHFRMEDGYAGRESNDNPVFYGEMVSFLLQLREEKYRAAALRIIERIGEKFPDVAPFGFSDNFTYSRYLLMLACAQVRTDRDYSGRIARVLDFFEKQQHPSGGIIECAIRLKDHAEAGVAIGDGSDRIADLLYCNNIVFCALSVLRRLPPDHPERTRAERMYQALKRFLLRIQIQSGDPRFNGGWMRGFDMDNGDYYGLNKDLDWGAYAIMAGWMTGFIPIVFLEDLGAPPFFISPD